MNKARRGEVFFHPSMFYLRDAYQCIAIDPDEQVQHVLRLILEKYWEHGTFNALARYIPEQDILLGIRALRTATRLG